MITTAMTFKLKKRSFFFICIINSAYKLAAGSVSQCGIFFIFTLPHISFLVLSFFLFLHITLQTKPEPDRCRKGK